MVKAIIKISRTNRFGEHSKAEIIRLARQQMAGVGLQKVPASVTSVRLYNSNALLEEAKLFYSEWKSTPVHCYATNDKVIISRTGWKHILHPRRTSERRIISQRYLGFAKDIIETGKNHFLLSQTEHTFETVQKIGIRAKIVTANFGEISVQVVLLRRINRNSGIRRCWFYSVHNRG